MYQILATENHTRDFVYKGKNKPLKFATKELAKSWILENAKDGVEYKAKEMKPKKEKPLRKKYPKYYGIKRTRELSLDVFLEKQVR